MMEYLVSNDGWLNENTLFPHMINQKVKVNKIQALYLQEASPASSYEEKGGEKNEPRIFCMTQEITLVTTKGSTRIHTYDPSKDSLFHTYAVNFISDFPQLNTISSEYI